MKMRAYWSLFVDPGFAKSNATGWAVFAGDALFAAGAVRARETAFEKRMDEIARAIPTSPLMFAPPSSGPSAWDILGIELPKIYPFAKQKGDPDDIVKLATLAGACTRVPHAELWLPRPQEWKGSTPEKIFHARIRSRMRPLEVVYYDDVVKDKGNAALTAIGLGFVKLDRWHRIPGGQSDEAD